MMLTSRTTFKASSVYYALFDGFCFKAKNLYNAALYRIREAYFEYDATLSYESLDKVLKRERNVDYLGMPLASSAQWTLQAVFKAWKSFWEATKAYRTGPRQVFGQAEDAQVPAQDQRPGSRVPHEPKRQNSRRRSRLPEMLQRVHDPDRVGGW